MAQQAPVAPISSTLHSLLHSVRLYSTLLPRARLGSFAIARIPSNTHHSCIQHSRRANIWFLGVFDLCRGPTAQLAYVLDRAGALLSLAGLR